MNVQYKIKNCSKYIYLVFEFGRFMHGVSWVLSSMCVRIMWRIIILVIQLFRVIRVSVNSAAFCRRRYQQEETTVQLSVLAVGSGWVFVSNEDCRRWEFMSQPTLFSMELHVGRE